MTPERDDPQFEPDELDAAPPEADEIEADETETDEIDDDAPRYRGANSDPAFGYLLALALIIGLTPFIPQQADLRYVIGWGALAAFGVLAWLFGAGEQIGREKIENAAWGVIFALIVAAPLLLVGGTSLTTTVRLMFQTGIAGEVRSLPAGAVAAFLIFVMPLAETLFFRGVLQPRQPFWVTGALATVWSILLFFPMLDVGRYPIIAVIIGTALVLMNLIYSYVKQRNGLAAAWVCQITVNVVLLLVPYFST
jgi:membrane protease YdiL (CAAX protease family)